MTVEVQTNFLSELKYVNEQIAKMRDWQSKNWAVGLSWSTGQPDGWCVSFAARGLNVVAYVRGSSAVPNVGDPSAYDQNVATLKNYIEKERQEEIASVRDTISQIESYKSKNWAIGLSWPNGQPDGFSRYFSIRGLTIAYYVRGNVSVGDPSAYDKNIATLTKYLEEVGNAKVA